jgi:hypothetical protein
MSVRFGEDTIKIKQMEEGEVVTTQIIVQIGRMRAKSWCPESRKKKRVDEKGSTCNILDPTTSALFRDALSHKYDSPQSFIRVKCGCTRKKGHAAFSAARMRPEVMEKVCALWDKQGGKCAFTKRGMVCEAITWESCIDWMFQGWH